MAAAKKRILVAEDTAALRFLVQITLKDTGYDVVAVNDGNEAWSALSQGDFDLVVTDYQMPIVDGFELCRRMRRDPRLKQIPVLLLTAKVFEIDVAEVQAELGLFTVLAKPFSPRELTRLVRERLGVCSA